MDVRWTRPAVLTATLLTALACGGGGEPRAAASGGDQPDAVHSRAAGGDIDEAADGDAKASAVDAAKPAPKAGKKGLVAFIAAASGNGVVRVDLLSGKTAPVTLPAGNEAWERLGWHFASAQAGALVLRAPDGKSACFWRYEAKDNAWAPASVHPGDGSQRCLDDTYREIFGPGGQHLVVAGTKGGVSLVHLAPASLDASNLILSAAMQRAETRQQFDYQSSTLGSFKGDAALDPARWALIGMSDPSQGGLLAYTLARAPAGSPLEVWRSPLTGTSDSKLGTVAAGKKQVAGSWDQIDHFLLGPGMIACKAAACEVVPAKKAPLPLFHHPGPAVSVVWPGSAGPGWVSLFDLRERRPYEFEVKLPFDPNKVAIDGWFPDERGPSWVRLVGFDGTAGFELPVDLDTLVAQPPESPRYAPLLAQPAAPQRYTFAAGYFFWGP